MDETTGTARLVDSRPEGNTLVATIGREEVEEALGRDEPVDLLLDVERVAANGSGRETQRISLAWETAELEQLLASSTAGELSLSFDEAELRRFLDEDVEAHGMREKLAVLTVAAGMAAAGAGAAAGAIPREDGGSFAPASVAAVTAQAPASEISTGLGTAPSTAAQTGRGGTASEVSTGIVGNAPAAPSEISTGIVQEPPVTPAEVTTGIVSQPTATPASSSPSGWNVDPALAALGAGAILMVAAAGFIARSNRHRPGMA
jgi:hypothetical protein